MIRVGIYEPYPMGLGGGNLNTQLYLVKLVDRSRFIPVVISPEETPFLARFRQAGAEVVIQEPPASIHRFAGQVLRDSLTRQVRNMASLVCYNLDIARLLRRRHIDVLYCNSIRAVLLAGFGASLARVPLLWYVKGELNNPFLDRVGFAIADRILFFCGKNRDDKYQPLVQRYASKIGILKIGLDPAAIREAEPSDKRALSRDLGIDPERFNIVALGQVYRPKGLHVAIEAIRDVVRDHPHVRLYIVGDHVLEEFRPYREELEASIRDYNLADHVRFTGWRTDSLAVLSVMDAQIHPSLSEGFGRAVLEGMALGKPVIASAVGGLREAIRDGENGFLVPPGDAAALAGRLRCLLGDADLRRRLGQAARQTVTEEYQIEDKVRQMESIWSGMAGIGAG